MQKRNTNFPHFSIPSRFRKMECTKPKMLHVNLKINGMLKKILQARKVTKLNKVIQYSNYPN